MSEERTNFYNRFRGKISLIDKTGIVGIIKNKGLPINK